LKPTHHNNILNILIFCNAMAFMLIAPSITECQDDMIYSKNSLYHRIAVYENYNYRNLSFGGNTRDDVSQSCIDLEDLDFHVLEYTGIIFAGLLLNSNPQSGLIIGLGGGVIPREMRRSFPNMEINVIEIDPEVKRVAQDFFYFETDEKMQVTILDGRVFVRRQAAKKPKQSYDMIILDAFNDEYIPFHLTTMEFLQEVAKILDPEGVLVANLFYDNQLFDAEVKTFKKVFEKCYLFFGEDSTNAILLSPGSKGSDLTPDEAIERAILLQKSHNFSFDIKTVAKQFDPDFQPLEKARILTDDHAPVNVLRQKPR